MEFNWSKVFVAGAVGASTVLLAACGGKAAPTATTSTRAAAASAAATATSAAASAPSPGASTGGVVASSSAVAGSTPSPATPNGTQVATYSFDLPYGFGAPLASTAPTRVEISSGTGDDVVYNANYGDITSGSSDQILSLPAGSTPTFSACSADTLISGSATDTRGSAFCVVENGTMAGVSVASVGTSTSGNAYLVLDVTIWQNTGVTPTSSTSS